MTVQQTSNGGETMCHKYATITESSNYHRLQAAGTDHQQRVSPSYLVLGQHHHQRQMTDQAESAEGNRSSVVCGRRARWQHVYTSTNHVVEIKLEWHRANPNYYVIFYEGKSVMILWQLVSCSYCMERCCSCLKR